MTSQRRLDVVETVNAFSLRVRALRAIGWRRVDVVIMDAKDTPTSSRLRYHAAMRYAALLAVLALSCASHAESPSDRYEIDPEHLTVGFLVEHVGFAKVFGMFREVVGAFTFDEETGEISDVRVVVQTKSVFTGVEARDRHLRSGDFLAVEEFPEMVFEADRLVLEDRRGELAGRLTIRGVTKPLTLSVTWNKSGESPLPGNPYVAGLSARGRFERSAYGMSYGVADGLVGNEVELILELEAQRQ